MINIFEKKFPIVYKKLSEDFIHRRTTILSFLLNKYTYTYDLPIGVDTYIFYTENGFNWRNPHPIQSITYDFIDLSVHNI